jgi:hypothetical protein
MGGAVMKQSDIYIVIVDISGYTEFTRGHNMAQMHAEGIITDLLEAVIDEMDSPLKINKLEGDAILAYAPASDDDAGKHAITQLPALLERFRLRRDELIYCNMCICDMCRSMGKLRLKAFVHKGPAILKEIAGHQEIAGNSVIFAHRLMKNSIFADEYILLSEDAVADLSPPPGFVKAQRVENIESYGPTSLTVWCRDKNTPVISTIRMSAIEAKIRGFSQAVKLDTYWFKRRFLGAPKMRPKY